MSTKIIKPKCFLCGSEAICTDTHGGNRKFYQCNNEDCGDYEISRTAMRLMEGALAHKQQAMKQVHAYRGTDKIVEFVVD
jgi:hypothetical protein